MAQDNTSSTSPVSAGSATQASTESASKTAASGSSNYSTSTSINSMEDLKNKAPEVYQKMLESIAMKICNEMKHHQERIKEILQEARKNDR